MARKITRSPERFKEKLSEIMETYDELSYKKIAWAYMFCFEQISTINYTYITEVRRSGFRDYQKLPFLGKKKGRDRGPTFNL